MCPSDSSPNGAQSTSEALEHATALHQQGRLTEAERVYAQMLEREPGQFVPLHRMAIVALQQGRLDEALRRVEAALRVDPGAEAALMNKGTILVALGRHDAALAVYGDVLAVDPASPDAHFNIGNALVVAGRTAEAVQSFARAVALRPNDPEVLRRHAGAWRKPAAWTMRSKAWIAPSASSLQRSICNTSVPAF